MEISINSKPKIIKYKTNQIPDYILNNKLLNNAIKKLPSNYDFEIHKTIYTIKKNNSKCIALQFPEGLFMYSLVISDIITHFTGAKTIILGDVTYGACCIDDYTAKLSGCDLIIHYGHSCLVPINYMSIKTLYIFVLINIDIEHLIKTIKKNIEEDSKIALLGTVQFSKGINMALPKLKEKYKCIDIPRVDPLGPGEVLGCTSPIFDDYDTLIFVADGRFHIESAIIQNPHVKAFRYNPYNKSFTREEYDYKLMFDTRYNMIIKASKGNKVGVVVGTLGKQGNPSVVNRIEELLKKYNKEYFVLLISEIFPDKLALFPDVDYWIEIACPRLCIDWGTGFNKPVLTPYEFYCCVGEAEYKSRYPMDWYSNNCGKWGNYYKNK